MLCGSDAWGRWRVGAIMTVRRGRGLQPAHRGYRWQDIATGYHLIRAITEGYDFLVVDRKEFEGDRIDDLELLTAASEYAGSSNPAMIQNAASRRKTSLVSVQAFGSTTWS
jgi:hypothetical protein